LTIAQTAQYSPKSQENEEFGKSGIVQMENAFCFHQVPVSMFHLWPWMQTMLYSRFGTITMATNS